MACCFDFDRDRGCFRLRCAGFLGREMKLETIAIYILTGLLVISSMLYIGSWFYSNFEPAIEYGEYNVIIPPQTTAPSSVRLCRDFKFNRAADLQISRYLVREEAGITLSIDVGSTVVHREPGLMRQCRDIHIPDCTPEGNWIFRTYVSWEDWPRWRHTEKAPDIPLRVVASECE